MNVSRALAQRAILHNQTVRKILGSALANSTNVGVQNLQNQSLLWKITNNNSSTTGHCRCYCSSTINDGDHGTQMSCKKKLEVDYDELKTLLNSDSALVFDVREPAELEEEGKISKAINIPLCELKKTLSMAEEAFCSQFGFTKPSTKEELVFYGRKSIKSIAATEIAHKMGFKKVKHYPGGFDEWKEKEKLSA